MRTIASAEKAKTSMAHSIPQGGAISCILYVYRFVYCYHPRRVVCQAKRISYMVHLEIKSTSVADGVAVLVASPKRRHVRLAICTCCTGSSCRRLWHQTNATCCTSNQGWIQQFWKGGGSGKRQSPKPSAEGRAPKGGLGASPRKFWKIRCDFLQFGIYFCDQNDLGYHSELGLCRTKNSSGHDFETHRY